MPTQKLVVNDFVLPEIKIERNNPMPKTVQQLKSKQLLSSDLTREFNKLLCKRKNLQEIINDSNWIKVQDLQELNQKPVKKKRKERLVVSERKMSSKNPLLLQETHEEPFNFTEEVNKMLDFNSVTEINQCNERRKQTYTQFIAE